MYNPAQGPLGILTGHVARANPLWQQCRSAAAALEAQGQDDLAAALRLTLDVIKQGMIQTFRCKDTQALFEGHHVPRDVNF